MHTIYRFYIEVKEMDYNAYMDALTGLLNKRGWKSLLKTVSTDKNIGIVVFDINNLIPLCYCIFIFCECYMPCFQHVN